MEKVSTNVNGFSSPSPMTKAAATTLLNLRQIKNDDILGPLTIPSKGQTNARTGLVHGTIRVLKDSPRTKSPFIGHLRRFEFSLESKTSQVEQIYPGKVSTDPMLVAFHQGRDAPAIATKNQQTHTTQTSKNSLIGGPFQWTMEKRRFAITPYDTPQKELGELAVSPFRNKHVVAFSVTCQNQVDCCFLYKVHSLGAIMTTDGTAPAREVECIRFTDHAQKMAIRTYPKTTGKDIPKEEAHSFMRTATLEENPFYGKLLHESCHLLQPQPSFGPTPLQQCKEFESPYVKIFRSAKPIIKPGKKVPSLNMKGRGAMTSNKNMQLVDSKGVVCLQVAKLEKDVYHVDFREPFNAFQAFAFGIAQIVL